MRLKFIISTSFAIFHHHGHCAANTDSDAYYQSCKREADFVTHQSKKKKETKETAQILLLLGNRSLHGTCRGEMVKGGRGWI